MIYQVAEKFKSIQGEGVYAGTPMAFIRFVGCSVGKTICQHCDTDFDKPLGWRGGGSFTGEELQAWTDVYGHICLTGGEPLNLDVSEIIGSALSHGQTVHIETSGTVYPINWFLSHKPKNVWLCVSPKPGWQEELIKFADEIKIIVPGLGNGLGWPSIEDALRWAKQYYETPIFLQPRNGKFDVDKINLKYVQDLIAEYPQFRLSMQLHKLLGVQ